MKPFIYTGPLSGVSLKEFGDVMLIPGAVVEMPAEHGYTARLIRKGWLHEVAAAGVIPEQENKPETAEDTETENEPEQVPKKKRRA